MDNMDFSIISEESPHINQIKYIINVNKSRFSLDFQNLIFLIRAFIFMCIFYMVLWIFRDRNADIRSLSYTFTLYNSFICSILSIYYYFTGSIRSVLLILASLTGYMLADTYYGFIYYHNLMRGFNGYIHHIIYLVLVLYTLYYDWMNTFGLFVITEIPTFILNLKHYFGINNFLIHFIIFLGFLMFRVLLWGFIIFKNWGTAKKYIFTIAIAIPALFLHIHWTSIHGIKLWKKYISQWT